MKTCAFTGHRPKSFPWKYDETARGCILLKETLTAQIAALADGGVTAISPKFKQGVFPQLQQLEKLFQSRRLLLDDPGGVCYIKDATNDPEILGKRLR